MEYPRGIHPLSLRRVSREPRELISVSRAIHNGRRGRRLLCVKEINRADSRRRETSTGLRVMEGFKEKERSTKKLADVARGGMEESSFLCVSRLVLDENGIDLPFDTLFSPRYKKSEFQRSEEATRSRRIEYLA